MKKVVTGAALALMVVALAPSGAVAASGSFSSSTATSALTGANTATGPGLRATTRRGGAAGYFTNSATAGGSGAGVSATTAAPAGNGVFGSATSASGTGAGVRGRSASNHGYGVFSDGHLGVANGKSLRCTACVMGDAIGLGVIGAGHVDPSIATDAEIPDLANALGVEVLSATGSDLENGEALRDLIDSLADPTRTRVELGPGTFDLGSQPLELPARVLISGAGEDLTSIEGNVSDGSLILMAQRARMQDVSIMNTDSTSSAAVVRIMSPHVKLTRLEVVGRGSGGVIGILVDPSVSGVALDDVRVDVHGETGPARGLVTSADALVIRDSDIQAHGDTGGTNTDGVAVLAGVAEFFTTEVLGVGTGHPIAVEISGGLASFMWSAVSGGDVGARVAPGAQFGAAYTSFIGDTIAVTSQAPVTLTWSALFAPTGIQISGGGTSSCLFTHASLVPVPATCV